MYPRLVIHLSKFEENLIHIKQFCDRHQVELVPVTKVFCADQLLIDIIESHHIKTIGDSRILNFQHSKTTMKKMLLRLPMLSEVKETIQWSDISLNSELEVIKALDREAKRQHKTHEFILMIDLGDLREGVYYKDLDASLIHNLMKLTHLKWIGVGTNLTCYGGVIPTEDVYKKLDDVINLCETITKKRMMVISGGNSSSVQLLREQKLPTYINQLRIGESIVLGRETAYGTHIPQLHDDVMTLEVEIIELKTKPSKPEGILGMDAFGETHHFEDRGLIVRALGAIGRQDISVEHLIPPVGIDLLGASSDHLVMEIKEGNYKVGDILKFKLTYGGILSLMTSQYVEKHYVR